MSIDSFISYLTVYEENFHKINSLMFMRKNSKKNRLSFFFAESNIDFFKQNLGVTAEGNFDAQSFNRSRCFRLS